MNWQWTFIFCFWGVFGMSIQTAEYYRISPRTRKPIPARMQGYKVYQ